MYEFKQHRGAIKYGGMVVDYPQKDYARSSSKPLKDSLEGQSQVIATIMLAKITGMMVSHIVGDKNLFVHIEEIDPDRTVKIVTQVGEKEVELYVDDVLYVENADRGLFSMQMAIERGYEIDFDRGSRTLVVKLQGEEVIRAVVEQGIWVFKAEGKAHEMPSAHQGRIIANYAVTDGVASLEEWHRRLLHTNHQYLKLLVDRGLVKGMMLSQREQKACDACHVGKQKRKKRLGKLDRGVSAPNQLVCADLLFPPKHNGTHYTAVLVVMDAWSRFVTIHPLKDKSAVTVNQHMQQYGVGRATGWSRNQEDRAASVRHGFPVQQILTDKGSKFVNKEMASWYAARGIEHVEGGPKSSHLNPCERTHQTLVAMMKAAMYSAGFLVHRIYALLNAVLIKKRIYCKPVQGILYQRMFGIVPDIHHIRQFGCLAYVQVPPPPERQKHDPNAQHDTLRG
ncbi:TPA: hypothetical protein N0F65_009750 [Lagenidium giganteum]|uniref:Integrase catalytic domain-containing protein n=1 Tax=Lagenidium giganteum TaxID=4803 RepID=A0AAV2YPT6_9STRA|nr:TPA: hypothetical protein N0F65_009750 [Lagenidium giganteum]